MLYMHLLIPKHCLGNSSQSPYLELIKIKKKNLALWED